MDYIHSVHEVFSPEILRHHSLHCQSVDYKTTANLTEDAIHCHYDNDNDLLTGPLSRYGYKHSLYIHIYKTCYHPLSYLMFN